MVGARIGEAPGELGRIANQEFSCFHDTPVDIRAFRSDGDAGLLCAGGAQPVVYPGLRGSLRAGIGLRFFAGSMAVRIGRGGLVRRRDPALGASGARKVNLPPLAGRASANFFQHLRIDVATTDDGYVYFCPGHLLLVE